ncbi:MAG TPA: VIT1/CCC1 transporter family protein [Capsulimonadaceae bacterium]|nr:VIT1/CCC1 transporter family protein [Capsulimonadaceae bacterium]
MATAPEGAQPPPEPPKKVDTKELIAVLRENWKNEMAISRVYHRLAEMEPDENRRRLLSRMAENEETHAKLWEGRLAELGVSVDLKEIDREVRREERYARMFGTMASIRRIEREERGHVVNYTAQTERLGDARSSEILAGIIPDEEAHANRLKAMADAAASPKSALENILSTEKWHRTHTGGWLGDAIYGVNDGLGAVFGIVSGMAGATEHAANGSHVVLLAGLAGMLASALSMGSGAYLATKSEREVHEAELHRERFEIQESPEHEREELELMYQLKGFSEEEAKLLADRMTQNPEQFLQTMASEELGIAIGNPPNPITSAVSAAVSTAVGAFVPIIPFFFMGGLSAVIVSAVISLIAHFAVGAAKTLVTGRSWIASGTEMTVVGVIEAAITFGLGLFFGSRVS